jgi:hypothetical protein
MSTVQPRIDVGAVSYLGLSSTRPFLAALSADPVAQSAVTQLEALGSYFPTSGDFAERVPDCLQRFPSTRFGRLCLTIGWIRGDVASQMSGTAGGQAAALLSTFLISFLGEDQASDVLLQLSRKILPNHLKTRPSGAQIQEVAKHLHSKMAKLSLGTKLAEDTEYIYRQYQHLRKTGPTNLLERMTVHSTVDLLYYLSLGLREGDKVVRISGSQGLLYIYGLINLMFPDAAEIRIGDQIISQGRRKAVVLEFSADPSQYSNPTKTTQETTGLYMPGAVSLPISMEKDRRPGLEHCRFEFHHWLLDYLKISFQTQGASLSDELVQACCNMLASLVTHLRFKLSRRGKYPSLPPSGFFSLLGLFPRRRMAITWQTVFGKSPLPEPGDIQSSFQELVEEFRRNTSNLQQSTCLCRKCNIDLGWRRECNQWQNNCAVCRLWQNVGCVLDHGLVSLFISAGENVTLPAPTTSLRNGATYFIDLEILNPGPHPANAEAIHELVMVAVSRSYKEGDLARSHGGTIYPRRLRELELNLQDGVLYELVDGRLHYNDRYHSVLRNVGVQERLLAKAPQGLSTGYIPSSNSGRHSHIDISLIECTNHLELRCEALVSQTHVSLDLESIITASYGVEATVSCGHARSRPLRPGLHVMETSIARPRADDGRLTIVQVAGDRTGQLLACSAKGPILLQTECCLNCAYEQAGAGVRMIIAG